MKKTFLLTGVLLSVFLLWQKSNLYGQAAYKLVEKIDFGSGTAAIGSALNETTEGSCKATYKTSSFNPQPYYTRLKTARSIGGIYTDKPDHTGNTDGYMLALGIISYPNQIVYTKTFYNLNKSQPKYRFSLWASNSVLGTMYNNGGGIDSNTPRIRLDVRNESDIIIASTDVTALTTVGTDFTWKQLSVEIPASSIPASGNVKITIVPTNPGNGEFVIDDIKMEALQVSDVNLSLNEPGIYPAGTYAILSANMSTTNMIPPIDYQWQSSSDGITYTDVPSASGTIASKSNAVSYTTPALALGTSPYYRLIYAGVGFDLTKEYNIGVSQNVLQPMAADFLINGSQSVNRYEEQTYEITGNPGAMPTWRIVGGCILSGQNTNTIKVIWTETENTRIKVTMKASGSSTSVALPSYDVNVTDAPVATISGPFSTTHYTTETYTLTNHSGLTPTWEVYGGTILSGQNTNTITVSWVRASTAYPGTRVEVKFQGATCLSGMTVSEPVNVIGKEAVFSDESWFWGVGMGLIFKRNNYGTYTPTPLVQNVAKTNTSENSLSVSNPYCDGENVFYTSANVAYNTSHQTMGSFTGNASTADGLACCYMGKNKFAVFSLSADAGKANLYYFVIDMLANNGKGAVSTPSNSAIVTKGVCGEGIELIAIPNTNNEYWLLTTIQRVSGTFIDVRKITVDLVNGTLTHGTDIEYKVDATNVTTAPFSLCSNANGTLISLVHYNLLVFRFNPNTGVINTNSIACTSGLNYFNNIYMSAFSPNSKYIYAGRLATSDTNGKIYQVEIDDSQEVLSIVAERAISISGNARYGESPKLGPDGKIYINRYSYGYTTVIHTPDIASNSVDFRIEQNAITYRNSSNNIAEGAGISWSTGITPPDLSLPGLNHEPTCPTVWGTVPNSASPTAITVNVKSGVVDSDGNGLYLIGAVFDDATEARATLTFDDAAGTVTFTPIGGKTFSSEERILVRYKIKDNGEPGSRCADGILSIGFGNYVPERAPIIFVTPIARGTGEGTSWRNSSKNLQDAINKAYLSIQDPDNHGFDFYGDGTLKVPYQVHIANGMYTYGDNFPVSGLVMKEGVNVFVENNSITNVSEIEVNIDGELYLDQNAQSSAWRYFGMPFTGSTMNVYDENGNKLSVNEIASGDTEPEVLIEYYDVANRGLEAVSTGIEKSENWKTLDITPHPDAGGVPYYSDDALLRGYGYIAVSDVDRIRIKSTDFSDRSTMFSTQNITMPTVYFEHPEAATMDEWYKTDYGWNLLSNPYSSYYRFDGTNHDFENPGNEEQEGALYSLIYWSEERSEYVALSRYDEAYLPPFKPVFFQVPDKSVNTFTFNNGVADNGSSVKGSGRLGGKSIIKENWTTKDANNSSITIYGRNFRDATPENTPMMRSVSSGSSDETTDVIFLEISGNGSFDKTSVIVNPKATKRYDPGWDLDRVIYANRSLPQIWTEMEGHSFSTNELPASADGITRVPVHFYTGETGTYRIGLGKANRLSYLNRYYLQNTQTGETKSLSAGESFYFQTPAGESAGNLVLIVENIFKAPTNINDVYTVAPVIYAKDRNIHITGITENSIIEIYDISGRCYQHCNTSDRELNIQVTSAGVYLVSVKSQHINQVYKVAVRR